MTKKKPLKEEQGVSILVTENWPHNCHSREVPLSHDIKYEASVLAQEAAGNRQIEACQFGMAGMTFQRVWPAALLQERLLGSWLPGQAIQGSLEDTLVGLHGLWGEGHCGKGM